MSRDFQERWHAHQRAIEAAKPFGGLIEPYPTPIVNFQLWNLCDEDVEICEEWPREWRCLQFKAEIDALGGGDP